MYTELVAFIKQLSMESLVCMYIRVYDGTNCFCANKDSGASITAILTDNTALFSDGVKTKLIYARLHNTRTQPAFLEAAGMQLL